MTTCVGMRSAANTPACKKRTSHFKKRSPIGLITETWVPLSPVKSNRSIDCRLSLQLHAAKTRALVEKLDSVLFQGHHRPHLTTTRRPRLPSLHPKSVQSAFGRACASVVGNQAIASGTALLQLPIRKTGTALRARSRVRGRKFTATSVINRCGWCCSLHSGRRAPEWFEVRCESFD
jgi:hypothetical protein